MPTATDRAHLRATWWGRGAAALALIAALLKVPGLISTWATYAAVRAVVRPGAGVSDDRGVVSVDTGVVADAMHRFRDGRSPPGSSPLSSSRRRCC
ncbi:hypothetical protein [Pseudonocardia zijingensis]|uniref:Uncharacterized protein n=1 Tax=Pseudonocardia zijingensis TaxID=153376 RepID=A0ABN1NXY5_9PSEU